MMRAGLATALALFAALAGGQTLDAAQNQRYRELIAELRCVVCQNRSIAASDAPLAADMRALVRTQIGAGRSNADIKHYLVERYGEWVLYRPPFEPATWLLWLGPGALLLLALACALLLWRRTQSRTEPAGPDPAAIERLLQEQRKE